MLTHRPSNSVLIVAAHADDEVLGCGGAIAKHISEGDDVHVLIIADGVTARHQEYGIKKNLKEIVSRENLAKKACKLLGTNTPIFARFPDNRCDHVPLLDIVRRIELLIHSLKPAIVYTHNGGDLNIDHAVTFKAVLTACRPLPNGSVKKLYTFETLSSTEWSPAGVTQPFNPTRFVDISAFEEIKMRALNVYRKEMRPFPHARSFEAIQALSRLRGAQVGLHCAEAFVVIRELD
jgi:LmbE family N-acetylglucosaminyl deacetylase